MYKDTVIDFFSCSLLKPEEKYMSECIVKIFKREKLIEVVCLKKITPQNVQFCGIFCPFLGFSDPIDIENI